MRDEILEKLDQLEAEREIRILFACESGSRAWGFPSLDSDYDVRFVYHRSRDWYLRLHEGKDHITFMVDKTLDLVGWDLRKTLRLGHKSNATPFEWCQSPVLYRDAPEFRCDLRAALDTRFSAVGLAWHYFGMATKAVEDCVQGKAIKLKRYFYALRTALCVRWIVERNEVPPIRFANLLALLEDQPANRRRIEELVELKSGKDERYMHHPEPELDLLLEETLCDSRSKMDSLSGASGDADLLNELFLDVVCGAHGS